MISNIGYNTLSAEFYDTTKPFADEREISFYDALLKKRKGPFLEAMCGSGRLLVPLVQRGYVIDGVDNSDAMLANCKERCANQDLQVNLFEQSLEALALEKQYDVIFIGVGSIQLIEDRDVVIAILKKLHEALLPGGMLILDTFIPWDLIKFAITGECFLSPKPFKISGTKQCEIDDGKIVIASTVTVYAHEQVCVTESVYTKTQHNAVVATEHERLAIRWYYRYELELLLKNVGFTAVTIHDDSFEHNPQAIVYLATK